MRTFLALLSVPLFVVSVDPAPSFGHGMLTEFVMNRDYVNINFGSYGTTPRAVLQAEHAHEMVMEAEPDRYFRYELDPALAAAREAVAKFVGADADDLALIDNASSVSAAASTHSLMEIVVLC